MIRPIVRPVLLSKTIRQVMPFAVGGMSQIVVRSVAVKLTKQLGRSVFVENKAAHADFIGGFICT